MAEHSADDSITNSSSRRNVSRRHYLKTAAGAAAVSGVGAAAFSGRAAANPITAENNRPGDDGWKPTGNEAGRPWRMNHRVEGYTSHTSVAPGDTVEFHVSTDPAERYRIDIYRLGWYDGAGGRLVASLPEEGDNQGEIRPIPEPGPLGKVACDWPVTDTLRTSKRWTSGLYLARFTLTSGEHRGESTAHPFVVREREDRGRDAKILLQLPIATTHAYNGWGGKSLYGFTSTDAETENGTNSADIVSFDRPIYGPSLHMLYAIHLLRFLEREGYDVSYVMDDDVHRNPDQLRDHELVISAGHDEYWSREQFRAFEDARAAGTNLAFVGANIAFWQVRYEDDERTMVCYKENAEDDPVQNEYTTDLFRNVGLPECELVGAMSVGAGLYNFPDYTVQQEAVGHPWMRETGFEAGDTIVGCIGHEWDWIREDCDVPGEVTNFFHYEQGTSDRFIVNDQDADALTYEAPSGAQVFSTGTMGYTWRIDPDPTWNIAWPYTRVQEYKPEVLEPDERLQQFTRNALDDLRKNNSSGRTKAKKSKRAREKRP